MYTAYKTGMRISVRIIVLTMPPTIGRAIRRITSDPGPMVRKIGINPRMIVLTVINLGRKR